MSKERDPFEEILRQYGGGQRRDPAPDDANGAAKGPNGGRQTPPPQVNLRLPGGCLTLIGLVVLLFIFGPVLLDMAVDWQWFGSLGYQSVFGTRLSTQLLVFAGALILAALLLGANWFFAARLIMPKAVFRGQQNGMPPSVIRWIVIGATALVALVMALAASGNWSEILQYFQHSSFGSSDALFNEDIGFYVFELPFYNFVRGWLLGLVVVAAIGVGGIYATRIDLFGSREGLKVDPRVSAHLAVLGAVFLSLISWGYWLSRYGMLYSEHDHLYGASYTDVHARLLGYQILMVVAAAAAVLLLINLRLKRPILLGAAFGVWVLSMFLVGGVYPGIVQNFQVTPDELNKESPYILNNIDATRAAFGIDKFTRKDFPVAVNLTQADVAANRDVVDNVRLWDYRPLQKTFTQLQALRSYYQFNDLLDIDRYQLAGGEQQVMLAARELNANNLQSQARTWVNEHLVFTHGYGVVAAPVNAIEGSGQPRFIVRDMPVVSDDAAMQITQPRIYYGEAPDNYVFVKTAAQEFDYPGQSGEDVVSDPYSGSGGVEIGTFWNKALFAAYLGDFNVTISEQIHDDSVVLFRRNFPEAVRMVAPFLQYDADPYIVIADGRLYWIQDAYTVTDSYPYSKPYDGSFNYIRNSVKVVIDAYNGSMDFYVVDKTDPLIQTYQRIFPDLFKDGDTIPASLRSHLRYPETMFNIQAQMYEDFHITNPKNFYNRDDRWVVVSGSNASNNLPSQAYYTRTRIPGQEDNSYTLMVPFTPAQRSNMVSWMAASNDQPNLGEVSVINFPTNTGVYGPAQITALINADSRITQQLTFWSQSGSQVIFGNLLVLPLGQSVLYVQPLFLQSSTASAIPELKQVIAASSGRAGMGETLDAALESMFGQRAATTPPVVVPTPGPGTPQPATPTLGAPILGTLTPGGTATACTGNVETLSASALDHYNRSQEALRNGDWTVYGQEQQAMAADLACLGQLSP